MDFISRFLIRISVILLLAIPFRSSQAQEYKQKVSDYSPSKENLIQRDNFQDMKFGLFIHWGIYSLLGDGEWVMHNQKIPYTTYKQMASWFYPAQFDAKEWVKIAKDAGMKYITITSRHHDGFSMFKTKASPYNIVDATPFKRDPIKELAEECEKQGIELHFYYSLLDWGRKDYGFGKPIENHSPKNTDWESYIAFMKTQLTELITQYPAVKAIWFDGHWERPDVNWHYDEIYALIHKLNPEIMIGNNHHRKPFKGEDFQMFEKDLPGENKSGFSNGVKIGQMPLETCETINNTWGFNINDHHNKSVKQLIHYLVNAAGRNANFLLNVGPMPNGKFQQSAIDTLKIVGEWMQKNGESIYGTRGGAIPPQEWGVITVKNDIHYMHILNNGNEPYLFIPEMKEKIMSIEPLNGSKKINFKQQEEGVFVYLDGIQWDDYDTVLKINI